jgi:hypothetical protein
MALIDVNKELSRITPVITSSSIASSSSRKQESYFFPDEHTERELVDAVLKLLNDPISEVKNLAVTWWVPSQWACR